MAVKSISFRLEENLLKKLHYIADYEGRSANSQVMVLIRDAIDDFEVKHGAIELEEKKNND